MRKYLIVLALLFLAIPAKAATYYLAQSAGTFTGGTACNGQTAITLTTFASTTLHAGDTAYLCGTITAASNAQAIVSAADGTNGSPISIIFDTGAILQAPHFSGNGGIAISNAYWVVDGGSNGIMRNSLTGTPGLTCPGGTCTDQPTTVLIEVTGDHDMIKNLNLPSTYVHALLNCPTISTATESSTTVTLTCSTAFPAGFCTAANAGTISVYGVPVTGYNSSDGANPKNFSVLSCSSPTVTYTVATSGLMSSSGGGLGVDDDQGDSNTTINFDTESTNGLATHNTISNTYTGISLGGSTTTESFNTLTKCNHCIGISTVNTDITGNSSLNDDISDWKNWDQPDNKYHHNGVFVFTGGSGVTSNNTICNHYIHGLNSNDTVYGASHITGWITMNLPASQYSGVTCNNVMEADAGVYNIPAGSYLQAEDQNYNNTVIDNGNGESCWSINALASATMKNNLCQTTNGGALGGGCLVTAVTSASQIDYNFYAGVGTSGNFAVPLAGNCANVNSFTNWSSSPYFYDANGLNPTYSSTMLNGSFIPQAGTNLIAGVNLTSLGITALNSDKNGAPRSASAAWTIGAYNVGSAPPAAPIAPAAQFFALDIPMFTISGGK